MAGSSGFPLLAGRGRRSQEVQVGGAGLPGAPLLGSKKTAEAAMPALLSLRRGLENEST